MGNRRFQSIPQPTHIDSEIRKILTPIIDTIERRVLRRTNERAVTREELLRLGLATQEQLNELPEN